MVSATASSATKKFQPHQPEPCGVEILGTGMAVPSRVVTNADISSIVDTNDEWIRQRTGIVERHICDPSKGEDTRFLCTEALRKALLDASIPASELDLIIVGTITSDYKTPSTACMVGARLNAGQACCWDMSAACCGFVYALNTAHDLIRMGHFKTVGVIGADAISSITDYRNRNVAILFGDGAGAAVIRRTNDTTKGVIAQISHSDGSGWKDLYVPACQSDVHAKLDRTVETLGNVYMNGREVFKFAVGTFQELIAQTLEKAGAEVQDIDMFVCHQSNARIIEAAVTRFGIDPTKVHVNIDRFGNTSGGSVPIVLDELRKAGRVTPGMRVMFVAFGAGLTWGSSLWQL